MSCAADLKFPFPRSFFYERSLSQFFKVENTKLVYWLMRETIFVIKTLIGSRVINHQFGCLN